MEITWHKAFGFATLVKEFYANMVEEKGKKVYIRGKWIYFNKEIVAPLSGQTRLADPNRFRDACLILFIYLFI